MKTFCKLLNTGNYDHDRRIDRLKTNVGEILRLNRKCTVIFELPESDNDSALIISIIFDGEINQYKYEPNTFFFVGHGTGMAILPRSLAYTKDNPVKVIFDLVDIFEEKTASK